MATQPFAQLGATPQIKKISGYAVALSPMAKVVADCGKVDNQYYLRLTSYETGSEIARHPLPHGAHTLEFSSDGRHLLVMPGGKGNWSRLLIYAEPWTSSPIVDSEKQLYGAYHGAWIDPRTIVIAGRIAFGQRCIGLLTIDGGRLDVVHDEAIPEAEAFGEDSLDTGACSRAGRIAFGTGYGRGLHVYRLADDRRRVIVEGHFAGVYSGNSYAMAVDDRTDSIVCAYDKGLTLFDSRGRKVAALGPLYFNGHYSAPGSISCRSGILAFHVHAGRGGPECRTYAIDNNRLVLWCTYPAQGWHNGCDVRVEGDRTLLAVEEEDRTRVLVLTDLDVLRLDAEDPEQRRTAVASVWSRRYLPARDALMRRINDENEAEDIRDTAVRALADMGDALAIPPLIRTIGGQPPPALADSLLSALQRFDPDEMIRTVLECAHRPSVTYRRGALRILANLPEGLDVIDSLALALTDSDREVRLIAARALSRRAAISAAPALLGGLDDPDPEVQLAVQQTVVDVLRAAGAWDVSDTILSAPLDMGAFAREIIASGRMTGFTEKDASPASKLLGRLAHACVTMETPEVLNAIESLTDPADIALAVAVIVGDAMRSAERWSAAISAYRRAADIAASIAAPAIEWRALFATGECLAATQDDRSAWDCYQRAMRVIDQLWFALLEEDKLQRFFHEKARLYDRAALCALRLGYDALALECSEKSKTRYLGDLIARRQRDPERVLDPELREYWRNTGTLRDVRVTGGTPASDASEETEIVAVGRRKDEGETREPGSTALVPKHLASFEQHWDALRGTEAHERLFLVRRVWSKVAALQADAADGAHECASDLYDAIEDLRQVMESSAARASASAHADVLARFDAALSNLLTFGDGEPRFAGVALGGDDVPFWISQMLDPSKHVESTLLLEAMQEALDTSLHRRPVLGVRMQTTGAAMGGIVFATRRQPSVPKRARDLTTVIQTSSQRFIETRWRYTMMLARGDTVAFREVADSVAGRSDHAHLQFTVTDEGTIAHLIRGRQSQERSQDAALRPAHEFETFMLPDVDDAMLRRLLVGGENSWFAKYGVRRKAQGRRAWLKAINDTLGDLHARVVAPLAAGLKGLPVRRLQIVPHRGLHLFPFAGMYRNDGPVGRRYVIDDYEIAYAPSSTLLRICKERSADKAVRRTLTAVGNPTEDLQFSPMEVEWIAAPFAEADRRILLAKQASARELRALTTNCFFHFAGHAYYDWNSPMDSALRLANGHRCTVGTLFDEGLWLSETMLVVLSACETNITDPHDLADEYIGLAAAFLFAGAPAVVCTLWAVDDMATMLLMGKFYHLLLIRPDADAGYLSPAAALRSAQLWLRGLTAQQVIDELGDKRLQDIRVSVAKGRTFASPLGLLGYIVGRAIKPDDRPFEHPYYWAAFIVVGDHAPLASAANVAPS
ncbi:MAG: CHAT domain-containing protein [Hyphomicrobiaceae bacterium]